VQTNKVDWNCEPIFKLWGPINEANIKQKVKNNPQGNGEKEK
jgi:hypothetical protein